MASSGITDFKRDLVKTMVPVAGALPKVPDDVVEHQLTSLEMFVHLLGKHCWQPVAKLLRGVAEACEDQVRRDRILRAAKEVSDGKHLVLAAESLWLPEKGTAPGADLTEAEIYDLLSGVAPEPRKVAYETGLEIYQFTPGLAVRVVRPFTDDDGQQIQAGEVLHFKQWKLFHYDDGHTVTFEEKVIRLCGLCAGQRAIIENSGNAYFEPVL